MSFNIPGIIVPTPFTPSLTFGGGSVGLTYNLRNCYYTSIIHQNNVIETKVWGYVGLSNKGSSTGQVELHDFPTPAGPNGTLYHIMCSPNAISSVAGSILTLLMENNSTTAAMTYSVAGGAGGGVTDSVFSNLSQFYFFGSYLNN